MAYGMVCLSHAGLGGKARVFFLFFFSLPIYKFLSAELLILLIRTTAGQRRIPISSGTLYLLASESGCIRGPGSLLDQLSDPAVSVITNFGKWQRVHDWKGSSLTGADPVPDGPSLRIGWR